jgi:hypothetical protein
MLPDMSSARITVSILAGSTSAACGEQQRAEAGEPQQRGQDLLHPARRPRPDRLEPRAARGDGALAPQHPEISQHHQRHGEQQPQQRRPQEGEVRRARHRQRK